MNLTKIKSSKWHNKVFFQDGSYKRLFTVAWTNLETNLQEERMGSFKKYRGGH